MTVTVKTLVLYFFQFPEYLYGTLALWHASATTANSFSKKLKIVGQLDWERKKLVHGRKHLQQLFHGRAAMLLCCVTIKKNSVVLVRQRTILIERSPPVSEASANFS
jgi:hypothetical protein